MANKAKQEKSKNWCSCGFHKRGKEHETGVHHKSGKHLKDNFGHGVKTDVGDPLNNL